MSNHARLDGPAAKQMFSRLRGVSRDMRLELLATLRISTRNRQDEVTELLITVLEDEALLDQVLGYLAQGEHLDAITLLDRSER